MRQFLGWKPGAPSQVRALSRDRSHPGSVPPGAAPRHLFSLGRAQEGDRESVQGRDRGG